MPCEFCLSANGLIPINLPIEEGEIIEDRRSYMICSHCYDIIQAVAFKVFLPRIDYLESRLTRLEHSGSRSYQLSLQF